MKIWMILIPIVLLGIGVGLAMTGIVNIPGISPKSAKVASDLYASDNDNPVSKTAVVNPTATAAKPPKPKPPTVDPDKPTIDPDKGAKKLAGLWNGIEVAQLVPIVKDWKDEDLVKVLAKMDPDKVAELLSALEPKRASLLSRFVQKLGSIVPPPPKTG
jgi:hypothetical protein